VIRAVAGGPMLVDGSRKGKILCTRSRPAKWTKRTVLTESTGGQRVHDRAVASLNELVATAAGNAHRDDPIAATTGGPAGNARLTAWTGLLLLALFLAETFTLISVGHFITAHILIGAFLIPLVILKTATTGWRIARYYLGTSDYRQGGPPPTALRLLGPLVILTGLAVLGSGLALIALGKSSFTTIVSIAGFQINALTIHQASFAAWLVVMGLHVLARTVPAVKVALGKESVGARVPGGSARGVALAVTLALGVLTSVLVLHFSGGWTNHLLERFHHHHHFGFPPNG